MTPYEAAGLIALVACLILLILVGTAGFVLVHALSRSLVLP